MNPAMPSSICRFSMIGLAALTCSCPGRDRLQLHVSPAMHWHPGAHSSFSSFLDICKQEGMPMQAANQSGQLLCVDAGGFDMLHNLYI